MSEILFTMIKQTCANFRARGQMFFVKMNFGAKISTMGIKM